MEQKTQYKTYTANRKYAILYLREGLVVFSLVEAGFGAIGLYCLSEAGVCNNDGAPVI